MNTLDNQVVPPFTNGAVHFDALDPSKKDVSKKEKKKRKKREKAEERDPLVPKVEAEPSAESTRPHPALRIQAWLRPASRTLDTQGILTAHKSSFLIAINCLMLSIAAHSIWRGLDASPVWYAMIPLALTNVLSLTFAVLSAQVRRHPTNLDALWAMPDDEYDPAVNAMLQDKQRAFETISHDLRLQGADLNNRQRHLRTAYNVLLGGVAISTCLFAICVAVGPRA